LDQNFVPKLCDFSISITIPPEQSHARDNLNIESEYCDPEYLESGSVTEKSDVFSFGMILLVFLTGKSASTNKFWREWPLINNGEGEHIQNEHVTEFVDPNIVSEKGGDRQEQQVKAFFALGLACVRKKGEERPDMIDVAKELMRIETFP
jgi:serine/threonine protein kinase